MKEIKLTQGKVAIVDDCDFEHINKWKWFANKIDGIFYALRNDEIDGKKVMILMHREVLNVEKNKYIDHIDGNGLNNCRNNLRESTNSQNQANRGANKRNTSGYKGVVFDKNKWQAKIGHNRKTIHLGRYKTKEEAAIAYNKGAIERFGEYAKLNIL